MHLLFDVEKENKNHGVELNLSGFGKDNIKTIQGSFFIRGKNGDFFTYS